MKLKFILAITAFAHMAFAQSAPVSLVSQPSVAAIKTDGFTLHWNTTAPVQSGLVYGTDANPNTWRTGSNGDTQHSIALEGLMPGTIYWVKTAIIEGNDTLFSTAKPYATQSLSTGEIKVFFNHGINSQYVGNKPASGTTGTDCLNEIVQKINNCKQTLDISVYNTNRDDIVTAVKNAHARGVRVRYIAAYATQNSALEPAPAFPVVYGNVDYLMHNKFMVLDADLVNDAWVMGGSMNWTTSNVFNDFNNMLMVQDQSLAKAYELEFNEMWGGNGAQPNAANQRFGNEKTDNTPHLFNIGGVSVECYFSPSDDVTNRIMDKIGTAQSAVEFGLLTFTKNEPSDLLVEKHAFSNVQVRGLIENINDTGSEYAYLTSNGLDVRDHFQSYQMHHKYATIDALLPNSDPMVWTGSHNWTFAAETQNDENSLVFHSSDIAKLFLAEFEARFSENPVAVEEPFLAPFKVLPNPAYASFSVISDQFDLSSDARIQVVSVAGRLVLEQNFVAGTPVQIAHIPDGSYIVKITAKNGFAALPLQKISR